MIVLYNMNMVCLDLAVAYMSIFWRLRYGICSITSPKEWDHAGGGFLKLILDLVLFVGLELCLNLKLNMRVVGENRYLYYTTILMVLEV